MKKIILIIAALLAVGIGGFYMLNTYIYNEKQGGQREDPIPENAEIEITPISHATMVLNWGGKVIYTDPTGGKEAFVGEPKPDIILLTDIHGDHFSTSTLEAVSTDTTVIVAPPAVAERIPQSVPGSLAVLENGATASEKGFSLEAIPMYNVPESPSAPHTKGRGNGYVVEAGGQRVYIAGDTGNTPEMRSLKNIDIAFVPMNLPYTMSVEEAADAVAAFKPKRVIPYHYRGQNGLSDTSKFKQLVNDKDPSIQVDLLNFYP